MGDNQKSAPEGLRAPAPESSREGAQARRAKDRLLLQIYNVVTELSRDNRFKVDYQELKTRIRINITIPFDEPKISRGLNPRAQELHDRALNILSEIEKESQIIVGSFEKKVTVLQELLGQLRYIFQHRDEICEAFMRNLKYNLSIIVDLNAQIHEINSNEIIRRKRESQKQREALVRGRFERVGDRLLKQFFQIHKYFIKTKVLDASNKHRAVLFAEVKHDRYDGWWYVTDIMLCGVDDNGELWRHRIYVPKETRIDQCEFTVEDVMCYLFQVLPSHFERYYYNRQGDLLVLRVPRKELDKVLYNYYTLFPCTDEDDIYCDINDVEVEKINNATLQQIVPSHEFEAPITVNIYKRTFFHKEHGYFFDEIYESTVFTQQVFVVDVKEKPIKILHPSHKEIVLQPVDEEVYVILPLVSEYRGD